MRILISFVLVAAIFTACRKDPDPVIIPDPPMDTDTIKKDTTKTDTTSADTIPSGVSDIVIRFTPVAGNNTITSSTAYYPNGKGDEFTVSLFNYYVSNVKLKKKDGTYYIMPDSYYLITHMTGLDSLVLKDVPGGYYTGIEFLIGVDSLRNVSGAQSGALDVGHGMFWDWNSGYIFYKLEGNYRSSSSAEGGYAFHIGGFQGPQHCLRTASLTWGSARVDKRSRYLVDATADAAAIFSVPHDIDFDTYFVQGASEKMFSMQADNYADMFGFVSGRVVQKP